MNTNQKQPGAGLIWLGIIFSGTWILSSLVEIFPWSVADEWWPFLMIPAFTWFKLQRVKSNGFDLLKIEWDWKDILGLLLILLVLWALATGTDPVLLIELFLDALEPD